MNTYIVYMFCYVLSLAVVGDVIYMVKKKWNGKSPLKVNSTSLKDLNIYDIFKNKKYKTDNKKSVFLINLAQRGYIKIRKGTEGGLFLDKLRDFSELNENTRRILEVVYSGNVSYHGDENAIMSYETVSWEDVKNRYRETIDSIFGHEFDVNQDDSEVAIDENVNSFKSKNINKYLIFMWVVGLLPVSISYWYNDYGVLSELFIDIIAMYITFGMLYGLVILELKVIKACKEFWVKTKLIGGIIGFVLAVGDVIVQGFLYLVIFVNIILAVAMVAVADEMNILGIPFNVILMTILTIVTVILKLKDRKHIKDVENRFKEAKESMGALYKRNLKKTILTQGDFDQAAPIAYIFDKMDTLNSVATAEMRIQPDWYEGYDWQSVEKLMLQLDK